MRFKDDGRCKSFYKNQPIHTNTLNEQERDKEILKNAILLAIKYNISIYIHTNTNTHFKYL